MDGELLSKKEVREDSNIFDEKWTQYMVCLKAELVKHVEEEGYDLTVKYLFNSNKYSALISHTLPLFKTDRD